MIFITFTATSKATTTTTTTTPAPPTTLSPLNATLARATLTDLASQLNGLKNSISTFENPTLVQPFLQAVNDLLNLVNQLNTEIPFTSFDQIADAQAKVNDLLASYKTFTDAYRG